MALLIEGGELVDYACNNGIHAEFKLAQRASPGSTILIYRFKNDGSLGWSKPSAACKDELVAKGIGLVGYVDTDNSLKVHRPALVTNPKPKASYPVSSFMNI